MKSQIKDCGLSGIHQWVVDRTSFFYFTSVSTAYIPYVPLYPTGPIVHHLSHVPCPCLAATEIRTFILGLQDTEVLTCRIAQVTPPSSFSIDFITLDIQDNWDNWDNQDNQDQNK